jgi:hypothetical protein
MSLASEIAVEISPFSTSSTSCAWSNNLNVAVRREPTLPDSPASIHLSGYRENSELNRAR